MLKRLKAKITSVHGDKLQRVMLDNDERKRLAGRETSAVPHSSYAKTTENQNDPNYTDDCWNTQQTMKGIIRAFMSFLQRKYEPIAVDE
jgi:hypothetical protein